MFRAIQARIQQKHRTVRYPKGTIELPERFRGLPKLDTARCGENCRECVNACPTGAIDFHYNKLRIDLGKCLFCLDCVGACPGDAITFSQEHSLSARIRQQLFYTGDPLPEVQALKKKMRQLFGRSLKLRQVSAGGCNACEADINVLSTVVFDLGRFGIQFVASPRHADGLLITGPVTQNMKLALEKTYQAVAHPKIVIALGACAISGGPYIGHDEQCNGVDSMLPVDLYIPGCPPHPYTILDGMLRLLGRLGSASRRDKAT